MTFFLLYNINLLKITIDLPTRITFIFRRPAQNYGQSYGQSYGHETIPYEENEIPEEDDEDDVQGECSNT